MAIILFDIDMTLIHTNGAGRAAMDSVLAGMYGVRNPTDGIRFDGRTDRAIFLEALGRFDDATAEAYERLAAGYLALLPQSLTELGGAVLPGVPELLDCLDRAGACVGLATGNMRAGAAIKLGYFGLWERFAGGGFGDDATIRAQLVTAGMVELAGIAGVDHPAPCVVLGDTPLDIEAAHVAGAKALGVATGRYSVEELLGCGADFAVADLSAAEDIADWLLAACA